MKKKPVSLTGNPARSTPAPTAAMPGKIHPVVVYPFKQPSDYSDLEGLYRLVAELDGDKARYTRPITVLDRKTHFAMEGNQPFQDFRERIVAKHSEILDAWCVDTCQMWYCGLGVAFERGAPGDVYWLVPGDFNYGSGAGADVLSRLHDLPEIILELNQDLCIGEICADASHSKQVIDTYGTFALLYNWFPAEAKEIRKVTERPRSEFFAIGHNFLQETLRHRWFAYEQTVVMLLQAVFSNKPISRFSVGEISDLPQGADSLGSAMQQVERIDRVLKTMWLERNQTRAGWAEQYRQLEAQSEQVRRTALIILQNLLI